MAHTVSCPACGSRFALGDDLFRRRVAGNLVKVRCRNCSAEIAVDATEASKDQPTLPSHEAPRRHPVPPRPKGSDATLSPLPTAATAPTIPALTPATRSPLPVPTRTPLPLSATQTPLPLGQEPSIWGSDENTVAINVPKPPLPAPAAFHMHTRARPPVKAPVKARPAEPEPESIDFEEIPASSSDAPTLDTLTLETGRPKPVARAADDFLVNLSAGTGGIMAAPTIDVAGLTSPVAATDELELIDAEEIKSKPSNPAQTTRSGTIPLFDMSAVLPGASDAAAPSSLPLSIAVDPPVKAASSPESKGARERKFVVAPAPGVATTTSSAVAPVARVASSPAKARRGGAAWWLGAAALAAGVVAIVGFRAGKSTAPSEPPAGVEAPTAVYKTPAGQTSEAQTAVAAAEPAPEPAVAEPAATSTPVAAAPAAPIATSKTIATSTATKPEITKPEVTEPATPAPSVPAVVKAPEEPKAPVIAKNAPPAAAPGTEFNRSAAVAALQSAAAQASSCRKDGDPSGTASLSITFAPSGRVTSANLQGPPFAGTPTGGCIASVMRRATIPAYDGDRVTVTKTIVVQ